ncbi:MAG: shikimate dehydrogenase [Lachnospiraceae bacterium]
MIGGKTTICGVIGCPIEHTISPLMHNFYARESGLDLAYLPFLVQPDQVDAAVRGAFALNISGLNVTVPHKQAVMSCLTGIDEAARVIGAVNTLVRTEAGYHGYNTDAAGLKRAMQEEQIPIAGQTCILLGAGGAAKAAVYMLAREAADKIYLLNRSVEKAEQLADHIRNTLGYQNIITGSLEAWREIEEDSCLAIQTTSVGMYPRIDDILIDDPAFYRKLHTAVDIIYTPMETNFMKMASGAKTMNGLTMLMYQGIAAFELWNPGVTIPAAMIARSKQLLLDHLGGQAR